MAAKPTIDTQPTSLLLELYWTMKLNSFYSSAASDYVPIDVPVPEELIVPDELGAEGIEGYESSFDAQGTVDYKHHFEQSPFDSASFSSGAVNEDTWNKFLDHLVKREGYENEVYKDSEGHLTVGVGHLLTKNDVLIIDGVPTRFEDIQVGDRISGTQVRSLLEGDASKAYVAGINQANELGLNNEDMVIGLGSVNFQLGTGWRTDFNQTWAHMKAGNFEQATENIENSKWAQQTKVRTTDFTDTLKRNDGIPRNGIDTNGDFGRAVAGITPETPQPNDNIVDSPNNLPSYDA